MRVRAGSSALETRGGALDMRTFADFSAANGLSLVGNAVVGPSDCNGAPTSTDYRASAVPLSIGGTGLRGFVTSSSGTIYYDPNGGMAATAPIQ